MGGCRVVQQALTIADKNTLVGLVHELGGHVREAVPSPHANYVIQKTIEMMPIPQLGFILNELAGVGACTARHRFGCRIICRLLEHSAGDPTIEPLVDEILDEAGSLMRHVFGHHVIHSVLEHGLRLHQMRVIECLRADLLRNAMNRNGSYVVERALQHSLGDLSLELAAALLSADVGVRTLAQNRYGCYVVKALLRFPGAHATTA